MANDDFTAKHAEYAKGESAERGGAREAQRRGKAFTGNNRDNGAIGNNRGNGKAAGIAKIGKDDFTAEPAENAEGKGNERVGPY